MVNKEIVTFKNYGKCLKLSNGVIEAVATLDIGPRVVFFGFVGGENIMNSQKDKFGETNNEDFDRHFYKGATWRNFGGHRLWASPESSPETYYPDCNPVNYELTDNGVILTPPPQTENGLAMKIELKMSDAEPHMEVLHSMTNISDQNKDLALWALSVCEQNGVLIIPMNTNNTGLLHNRVIAVWPYTKLNDDRLFFGSRYVTLRQDPTAETPLKLGFDLNKGTAWYVLGESVFQKQYRPNHPNGRYPDGGVSMETYSCGLFTEVETLSEQKVMKPGTTETHTEIWTMLHKPCELNEKDEASVEAFVSKLS